MNKIKACVVNFLGTNCEKETLFGLVSLGYDAYIINHNETNLDNYKLIVLPGGFSFGDYINPARLAKFCPVIEAIKNKIKQNNCFILGICNGFQILCEAKILPGALLENIYQKFICKDVELSFQNKVFSLPIAHKQGRYYIDDTNKLSGFETIKYKNNPNGSEYDIAGIYDKKNHILGLMPHPERNLTTPFKSENGKIIFDFIDKTIRENLNGTI